MSLESEIIETSMRRYYLDAEFRMKVDRTVAVLNFDITEGTGAGFTFETRALATASAAVAIHLEEFPP